MCFMSFMRVAMITRPSFYAFIAFINGVSDFIAACFTSHLIAIATVAIAATATATTARLIVATFGYNAFNLWCKLIDRFGVRCEWKLGLRHGLLIDWFTLTAWWTRLTLATILAGLLSLAWLACFARLLGLALLFGVLGFLGDFRRNFFRRFCLSATLVPVATTTAATTIAATAITTFAALAHGWLGSLWFCGCARFLTE